MRPVLNPEQEELLLVLRDALSPGQDCYLVGGAVRDILLGRPLHDLDFALPDDPTNLAKRMARELNVGYFVLDDQRHTARVVYQSSDGGSFPLDFVQFTGETLEADLRNRDFTLNAMALAVDDLDTIIDPMQGQADLRQGLLRTCSPHALVDDPVRILRAVRLAKAFSLAYAPGLGELAQAAALNLPNTSAERQRDELFRILNGPDAAGGIADADRFGAFTSMIPLDGLPEEKEILSNRLDHSCSVVTYFQTILRVLTHSEEKPPNPESPLGILAGEFTPFREQLLAYFSVEITLGRTKTGLSLFSLLLLGKGISATTPELAWDVARRYQLSNAEADFVRSLVSEHDAVAVLSRKDTLDRRAIYRYFKRAGKVGVAVAIIYLATQLAGPGRLPNSEWREKVNLVKRLLEAWWYEQDVVISPRPFLNGNEIKGDFDLPSGALIGELLRALQEAQASGEIGNKEEARKFITDQLRTK